MLTFSHVEALKDICLTVTLVIASVLVLCEVAFRLFIHPIDAPTSGQVRSAAAATER